MNRYLEPIIFVFTLAFIGFGFYLMWKFNDRLNYIDVEIRNMYEDQIVTVPDYMGGAGTTEEFISEKDLWNRMDRLVETNKLKE